VMNAAMLINLFNGTENKRDDPCQEFGRDVTARSRPTITVKRKGFLFRPWGRRLHSKPAIAQVLFSRFSHTSRPSL
jgi:hypothetical protein